MNKFLWPTHFENLSHNDLRGYGGLSEYSWHAPLTEGSDSPLTQSRGPQALKDR